MKAYLEDARARSRAGRRIWSEAMVADALPQPRPEAVPDAPMGVTRLRLEADRASEPVQRHRVAAVKTFVLNKETRRLHVFAAGKPISLCRDFSLSTASALPNPVLEGRAWRGTDVDPCVRCRRVANAQNLLDGGRPADDAGGSSSSEASDSGEAE